MKRFAARIFLKAIPPIAIILILAEFFVSNYLAGIGANVGAIDQKIVQLREENELIRQHVASASALVAISARALELGFIEPTTHVLTIAPEQSSVAIVPNH